MLVKDFVEIALDFADLGWSIQQQFRDVVEGESLSDQNPAALDQIADFLLSHSYELDDADDIRAEIESHLERTI